LRTIFGGIRDGSIRYREDITDDIESAPGAFLDMLDGRNFNKSLVSQY
jgi:NADPH-dependent curcumin reductase CurA